MTQWCGPVARSQMGGIDILHEVATLAGDEPQPRPVEQPGEHQISRFSSLQIGMLGEQRMPPHDSP